MKDQTELKLERLKPEDVLESKKVIAQSYIDTYINPEEGVTKEWVDSYNKVFLSPERVQATTDRLGDPKFASWVVKNEVGQIAGVVIQYYGKEGEQNIMALYVDKLYHGQGVAQLLMDGVLGWFDAKKPIYLGVATYNDRAKAFYRKWGFEEVIGSDTKFLDTIPEIKMVRKGDR